MIELGTSFVAAREILGHSGLEMTMRYAHPHDSLKDAVEILKSNFSQPDRHKSGQIWVITYDGCRTELTEIMVAGGGFEPPTFGL
jgi:hypothetical protein